MGDDEHPYPKFKTHIQYVANLGFHYVVVPV